ncbi:MAG: hypothetical protein ACRDRN_01850 [Sciscionella sp.]
MSVTGKQVKALLADPYVPQDKKDALIQQLPFPYSAVASDDPGKIPDDASFSGDAEDRYDDAKSRGETNAAGAKQDTTDVTDAKGKTDSVQQPSSSGGAQTSDEVMKIGEPGLKVFKLFQQAWSKRPSDCVLDTTNYDYQKDIVKRYQEQYGINFKKFLADSDKFSSGHTTLVSDHDDVKSQLASLYKDWTGASADASHHHYDKNISPNIDDLSDALNGAGQLIPKTVHTVYQRCHDKMTEVLDLYEEKVACATSQMAELVVEAASGQSDLTRDKIEQISRWVDQQTGSNITSRVADDSCSLNQDNIDYVVDQCKKWIRDSFNVEFYGSDGAPGLLLRFKKICDDTKEQVDQAWQNLTDPMAKYQNGFPADAGGNHGGGYQGNGHQGGGNSGGGGYQGGGSAGGGGNPAMNVPPANAGTTPSASRPSQPVDASVPVPNIPPAGTPASGTAPSGADPSQGGNPSVSVPGLGSATTSPASADPSHAGNPAMSLPGMGGGGSSTLPGQGGTGSPESVKVDTPDGSIEMTSPDGQGQMKLTIDHGSGKPKSYDVDFGQGALPSGLGGVADAVGAGAGASGVGSPGGDLAGGDGTEHVQADANGTAVIHDGKDTITVERSAQDSNEVKVTVDDGSGKPTTYTMDYSDPSGSSPGAGSLDASAVPASPVDNSTPAVPPDGGGAPGVAAAPGSDAASIASGGGGGGGGHDFAGAGAHVPGGGAAVSAQLQPGAQSGVDPNLATAGAEHAAPAGSPGVASAPGGGGQAGGQHAGGMPMMGGMGGAGGGQGGDTERGASAWRTTGQLFDDVGSVDESTGFRAINGVLGEDRQK